MHGGRRAGAGRKKGTPNAVTKAKKAAAAIFLPDVLENDLWNEFLHQADPRIKWEAFKLAVAYKKGQPPRAKEDNEAGKVIILNHIPLTPRGD